MVDRFQHNFEFCRPEVLQQKPYGKAVDVWSIGVIVILRALLLDEPQTLSSGLHPTQRLSAILRYVNTHAPLAQQRRCLQTKTTPIFLHK